MIVELPMKAAGDPAEDRQTLSRLQGECPMMLPRRALPKLS
jgi:hypothetical protein